MINLMIVIILWKLILIIILILNLSRLNPKDTKGSDCEKGQTVLFVKVYMYMSF